MNQVITRAAEAVRPLIEAKQHQLSVVLTPEPLSAMADAARLEQVLYNLLANAAKYTDRGGTLTLSCAVRGAVDRRPGPDNGIGLAPEQISGVFDLFAQTNGPVGRSQGGLGIGLPLVRTLVEMHGGSVSASSEGAGKGSEFTVKIPGLARDPELERRREGLKIRSAQNLRLMSETERGKPADPGTRPRTSPDTRHDANSRRIMSWP